MKWMCRVFGHSWAYIGPSLISDHGEYWCHRCGMVSQAWPPLPKPLPDPPKVS